MASRSLNKVILIGNLTRDPELRYTPAGTAVCTFGLATNRSWTTESGEKKEETEFHRIVAWNKLAELCSKFLFKGRRVFVEGRLQTRRWTAQDGREQQSTEVVIDEMIILDNRQAPGAPAVETTAEVAEPATAAPVEPSTALEGQEESQAKKAPKTKDKEEPKEENTDEVKADDIPF